MTHLPSFFFIAFVMDQPEKEKELHFEMFRQLFMGKT